MLTLPPINARGRWPLGRQCRLIIPRRSEGTPIAKRTTSNWIGCGGNCCDHRMFSSERDNDVSTITNAGCKGTLAE
jgi:hypothetical protein